MTDEFEFGRWLAELNHRDWQRRLGAYQELARRGQRGTAEQLLPPTDHALRPAVEAAMSAPTETAKAEIRDMVDGVCRGEHAAFVWTAMLGRRGDLAPMDLLHERLRVAWSTDTLSREKHRIFAALYLLCPNEPLYAREVLCLECYSRFQTKYLGPGGTDRYGSTEDSVTFPAVMACRQCDRARFGTYGISTVVAVLDDSMACDHARHAGSLHVNFARHRRLFDFDHVEIVHGTDRDVETLCMLIGNDDDERRLARYPTMPCVVWTDSGLSKSALNMLESTFPYIVTHEARTSADERP